MSEEIFVIKQVKNIVPWTYVISDLNGEKTVGTFFEKELQKNNSKCFQDRKINFFYHKENMSNGRIMIIHLIVGLIKTTLYKLSQPYEPFREDINVKVDLSN